MAENKYRTAPDPNEKGWPSGIKYIIGNEGCERFSYYGMRAILFFYLISLFVNLKQYNKEDVAEAFEDIKQKYSESITKAEADGKELPKVKTDDELFQEAIEEVAEKEAKKKFHYFTAAVYAFPILGAIIADRLLGKYRTILWLSMVYCLGHGCLAFFEDPALQESLFGHVYLDEIQGLFLGLGLIAIGSGGIKPCVSAHVGDQFGKSNWFMIPKVFNAFYFIINFGSAFATIIIPRVRGVEQKVMENGELHISYAGNVSLAFAIPGILMGLATIFFYMGRREFVHVPPTHPGKRGVLDVLASAALFAVVCVPMFFHEQLELWALFAIPAGCLVLFYFIFSYRQKVEQDDGFLAILFYCFTHRGKTPSEDSEVEREPHDLDGHSFWGPAVVRFGGSATEGPVAVLKIMSVFISIAVFWALFDQHSSSWLAQAKKMDLTIDFPIATWLIVGGITGLFVGAAMAFSICKETKAKLVGTGYGLVGGGLLATLAWVLIPAGFEVQPSEIPTLNPFLVMILIPLTTIGLYPFMRKIGIEPKPLTRMTIGMGVTSFSFVAVAIIQAFMDSGAVVHVGWQVIPYIILTTGEVMVSITGLEFAYSQAPKRMKSVIMGFWLFMVSIGSIIVAVLAEIPEMDAQAFFWMYAAMMAVAAVGFGIRAKFYTYKDYSQ
jgi:POT family proton-dependent oligopeptide transporter